MPASTREGCELSDLFLDEDGLELLEEASGIPGEKHSQARGRARSRVRSRTESGITRAGCLSPPSITA